MPIYEMACCSGLHAIRRIACDSGPTRIHFHPRNGIQLERAAVRHRKSYSIRWLVCKVGTEFLLEAPQLPESLRRPPRAGFKRFLGTSFRGPHEGELGGLGAPRVFSRHFARGASEPGNAGPDNNPPNWERIRRARDPLFVGKPGNEGDFSRSTTAPTCTREM